MSVLHGVVSYASIVLVYHPFVTLCQLVLYHCQSVSYLSLIKALLCCV